MKLDNLLRITERVPIIKEFHDKGLTGKGITIGIIDSGFNIAHDELRRKTFLTDMGGGTDFYHGTAVASVAAGRNIGVAPHAELVCIDVCKENRTVSSDIVAKAIRECVYTYCDIINISLRFFRGKEVEEALKFAEEEGVIVVAAAGNDGDGDTTGFPADHPTVLSVGSVNSKGDPSDFSSPNHVDVVTLGENVLSAYWKVIDDYTYSTGTSFAAPIISGFLALLIQDTADDPDKLPPQALRNLFIRSFVKDIDVPGYDKKTGHGTLGDMNKKVIVMKVGSCKYTVNGVEKMMDVGPIILESRTMVPIRFVAEELGRKVTWDEEERTVMIE
jgi:subtilisin family serine protease